MGKMSQTLTNNSPFHWTSLVESNRNFSGSPGFLQTSSTLDLTHVYCNFAGAHLFQTLTMTKAAMTVNYSYSSGVNLMGQEVVAMPLANGYNPSNVTYVRPGFAMIPSRGIKGTVSSSQITFNLMQFGNDLKLVENGICLAINGTGSLCAVNIISVKIDLEYDLTTPILVKPLGGFVDSTKPAEFEWAMDGVIMSSWATFNTGTGWGRISLTSPYPGDQLSVIAPANTFPKGNAAIQWQVGVSLQGSTSTVYSDIATFSTDDLPPLAPTLVRPINIDVDTAKAVTMRWVHNSPVGSDQSAYDIAYTLTPNNAASWIQAHGTSATPAHSYAAGLFGSGQIYWRVRTYNTENEVGAWSDVGSFFSISAPDAPVITSISQGTARPVFDWFATVQNAYRVIIRDAANNILVDTGKVAGSDKTYKTPIFLEDNLYNVEIYVYNEYGLESLPATSQFVVATNKPAQAKLVCTSISNGIRLDFPSATSGFYILYRRKQGEEAMAIAIIDDGSSRYEDLKVAADVPYFYFIRYVNDKGAFSDSVEMIESWTTIFFHLSLADQPSEHAKLRWHEDSQFFSQTASLSSESIEIVGRERPITDFSGFKRTTYQFSYLIRKEVDSIAYTRVLELFDKRQTMLARTAWGDKAYISVADYSPSRDLLGVVVSFSATEVDYDESVTIP